jgi:2-polyprenyl-6-methoxyphenol hydroxylase-like FAD-dependent oxidoreductase
MKAIVIGAGIGGITAGISLQRAGVDVSVYEQMPELREVGSGLTLWVNAMRALRKLDAADAVRDRGAVVERLQNRTDRGDLLSTLPIKEIADKYGAPNVGIHRGRLQATLAEALQGGALELGTKCTGLQEADGAVVVQLADGREERADVVVGADGINSTVRAELFGREPPRYAGYTCWRSAVKLDHDALKPGYYHQLYGAGSNFGIFPIGEGEWSWYGTKVTGEGETAGSPAEWKRQAVAAFRDWWEPVSALIEATDESGFVRQDIYDRVPIDTWSRGRVTLLGDAAHATTPALGQGGCMAIEDALVLGKGLKNNGGNVDAALRAYEAQRRTRANGIVRQARRHGAFYHASSPVVGAARYAFLRFAPVKVAMRAVDKLMGYEA